MKIAKQTGVRPIMLSAPGDESRTRSNDAPGMRSEPARRPISLTIINFWLDAFLLAVVVALGWVSAVLRLVFPRPSTTAGWKLWGWTYDQWADVQFACLCVLAFGVVVHVMLHWSWVCGIIATRILKTRTRVDNSMQTIYGVGFLVLLLHLIAAGVIAAMYFVRQPPV